jgi:hypothetical protein
MNQPTQRKRPPALSSVERERRMVGNYRWWLPVDEDLNIHAEADRILGRDQVDPLRPAQGILLGAAVGLVFWAVAFGALWWVTR